LDNVAINNATITVKKIQIEITGNAIKKAKVTLKVKSKTYKATVKKIQGL
jgi:hypothetical protein